MSNDKNDIMNFLGISTGLTTGLGGLSLTEKVGAVESSGELSEVTTEADSSETMGCGVGSTAVCVTSTCVPYSSYNLTSDDIRYANVERRAEKIYDTFDKNHDVNDTPSLLIVNSKEKAEVLRDIMFGPLEKKDLLIKLTALGKVLEEGNTKKLEK